MHDDKEKTKDQLINELVGARQRIAELEIMEAEYKRVEETLRTSEERYRTLAESSPDCIKLLDLDGTIIECNTVAVQCFKQKSKEDFIGKKLIPFFPEEYRPDLVEALDGVRQGQEARLELQTRTSTGSLKWWDITINPIRDEADQVISILFAGRDMTERKRAEQQLKESFDELDLLYRSGRTITRSVDLGEALGFIVQETPTFIGATQSYILMMDEDRNELVGFAATEPYSDDFKKVRIRMDEPSASVWALTHNEPLVSSRAREDERLSQRLVEQYRIRSAVFLPLIVRDRPLGVLIYVHDQQEGAFDHMDRETLSRFADQTALAVANIRLLGQVKESRNYLETLIEQSMDAIIATDRHGRVVLFNRGAETLSGYRREEVIGRRAPVIYDREEDAKEVMRRMREGDGTVSAFETTFRAKDGSIIPVLISASILYDEKGREAGTVGFSKNLRERKRTEEQLQRAQASAIAAEKLVALGRLTAGVSHEILNPLTVITLGLHRTINSPDTHPELKSDLQEMREQADRITKIVEDFLYFARHRPPERRVVNFNETVERTLGLVEQDLKLDNITVELDLAEELPPVSADHDQLQQVILNLLTNARDAMPDVGRLVLSTKMVQTDGRKFVELRVEDTGLGIAPEHMEQLFDPFFTTKPEGEGTGMGLSICKGIVEAHGGSIRAENVPGGGAVFAVRLGVEEVEREGE